MEDVFGLQGTVIKGNYRVDAAIGEGGFGVVYRGWHVGFDHAIAVKCLKVPPHFTAEAKKLFFERFREEGRLLSRLSSEHLSIVRVYDFGVTEPGAGLQAPYLVLEWLEGKELADVLRRRAQPFSEAEAVQLLRPAIEAIAVAHRMKIAHRDLKPANLFVVQAERLKVLDFGIAKAMQEGETATQLATRTSSGFSAFSPGYGAPEQFQSKKYGATGPWTDVHALGLILVECVSGRPPLDGEEQFELFAAATSAQRPTPRARGATVSDAFEAVLATALALAPRDRYPDAAALLQALDGLHLAASVAAQVPVATGSTIAREPLRSSGQQSAVTGQLSEQPSKTELAGPLAPDGPALQVAGGATTAAPLTQPSSPSLSQSAPGRERPAGRRPSPLMLSVGGGAAIALAVGLYFTVGAKDEKKDDASTGSASDKHERPAPAPTPAPTPVPTAVPTPAAATMVAIPAGSFAMGSDTGEADEKPVHQVSVKAFSIDVTEVTVAEYRACVSAERCTASSTVEWSGLSAGDRQKYSEYCNWTQQGRDKHPMNCVDWNQAEAYCGWASKRLPTEEEWEYAARGSDGRSYPWGAAAPAAQACWNGEGNDLGKSNRKSTCPVGSYHGGASPFGALDIAGNVWEWTSSKYCPYTVASNSCANVARVFRGGSWDFGNPSLLRAAVRSGLAPAFRFDNVGFRCARAP